MTRERFEMIQREFKQAIAYQPPITLDAPLLLWGETIAALEEAWIERDNALKEGLALTVEKDGMQIEIDRLRAENAVKDKEIAALSVKVEELQEQIESLVGVT